MHQSPPRRSLRRRFLAVLPGAVLAVLVLLPGTAWAGDVPTLPPPPTDPVGSVTGAVGDVLSGGTAGGGAGDTGASQPAGADAAPQQGTGTQSGDPSSALPQPPSQLDPSQLDALLAALGISKDCSAAVQKDLQKAIADLPATVQAIVDAIVSQLPSGPPAPPPLPISATDPQTGATVLLQQLGSGQPPTFSSPDPGELPTVKDLQQLADDLQKLCLKPPTINPPTSGGSQLPPPPQQQPVSAPQAPAAAPPPAAQPVSYPGYAPTGAAPVPSSGGGVPLAGLAGIVLLSAAGAASWRTAFRAGPRS